MNKQLQAASHYVVTHKKKFMIGAAIVLGVAIIATIIALAIVSRMPRIVYQPAKACDMLTPAEAQQLLGDKVFSVDSKNPVIAGNTATSKCSYTDANPDKNNMIVAAIAVRSAINDDGDKQNAKDFETSRRNNNVEIIKNVGQRAYFNQTNGKLNVLDGHNWIILNYGIGSAPEANTPQKAVELAKMALK